MRTLDDSSAGDFDALESAPFFRDAMDDGRVIRTWRLDEVPQELGQGGWVAALEHDRVPVVTFPFEWTFSMLRDAALLTLDLTEQALDHGLILKDATPFNVQFVGARPTFIDIGSFERFTPGEPWFGYRQFCEQFLNPLLLQAHGVPSAAWIRGSLRGITPGEARAALPLSTRARPSVFVHVGLHAWAERRYAASNRDVRSEMKSAGLSANVIRGQVRRLRKVVERLKWKPRQSAWSEYTDRTHYTEADLAAKEAFVRRIGGQRPRRRVLDIGANDARFTEAVLDGAEYAVAMDADPLTVDALYRRCHDRGATDLLPVCLDVASASSAVGWRGRERPAFLDRVRPDLVLMLAVVHHLAITEMVPLDEIVALIADVGAETIVEVPTPDDPMVSRLARAKKARAVPRYSPAIFEAAAGQLLTVAGREVLPSGSRILYHLTPRS